MTLKQGEVVDNRYEILSELGRGGMSVVYLAMDKRLNKTWAIKEVKKEARIDSDILQSGLAAEIETLRKLHNQHLPSIADVFEYDETRLIVMDFVEGSSLEKLLDDDGAQAQEQVIDWGKQICNVLQYLHSQNPPLIYRDMKPDNIMLESDGNVVLIDFGTVRELKDPGKTSDTKPLGTEGYAAPEQMSRTSQSDARTDIYTLGATLYHLVTGYHPKADPPYYGMVPIRQIIPTLSGGLEAIIIKCTNDNPDLRYQSADELLYDLEHYDEVDELYRNKQKRKLFVFVTLFAMSLVSLAVGIIFTYVNNSDINNRYAGFIENASVATAVTDKIDFYKQAIDLIPDRAEAYSFIIASFSADGNFATDEQEYLTKKLYENSNGLKVDSGYLDVIYDLARAYWFYNEYGNDSTVNMDKALPYYSIIADNPENESYAHFQEAEIYRDIATYWGTIVAKIETGEESGAYREYWNSINELEPYSHDSTELVKYSILQLSLESISNVITQFKADGVTENEVREFVDHIYNDHLSNDEPQSAKTRELREKMMNNKDAIYRTISRTYAAPSYVQQGGGAS